MVTSNARFWKHVLAKTSKNVALSILGPAVIKALAEVKDFDVSHQFPDLPPPEHRAAEVIQLLLKLQHKIIPAEANLAVNTWATYHCGLGRPGLLFNAAHALLCAVLAKGSHSMRFRYAIQYLSWFDMQVVLDPVRQLCLRADEHFEERRLQHMFSTEHTAQQAVAADRPKTGSG